MSVQKIPSIVDFDPTQINWQYRLFCDMEYKMSDSKLNEVLLSGSKGSAKTTALAHFACMHCLSNSGAVLGLGRNSLPSLKETLVKEIVEHIDGHVDYKHNSTTGNISFANGSEIICYSWSDKRYTKLESKQFSSFIVDELTENHAPDVYEVIQTRIRLSGAKRFLVSATNPDTPSHWAYKRFISEPSETTSVYYSLTSDNPFLPEDYEDQIKRNYDDKMVRRMLYGEWLAISEDVVYSSYSRADNYVDKEYAINPYTPVWLSADFNIGEGKPMSFVLMQFMNGVAHVFDEIVIEGARTLDVMEEIESRGYFNHGLQWVVCGDATGASRDTRGSQSDYDIIYKFLSNVNKGGGINYVKKVPRSNPRVRDRHNKMNAYCKNALGQVRFKVYKKAKTADEGMRLTKLKKGGSYIEDDSKAFQHITTAIGYAVCQYDINLNRQQSGVIER